MPEALIFFFSVIASTQTFVLLVVLTALILLWSTTAKTALLYVSTVVGFSLSVTIVKALTRISRQADVLIPISGYSFPSGHAAGITFLALTTAFLTRHLPDIWRLPLYGVLCLLVLAISFSRVYYKAHSIPEVLAGFVFGLVWAGIFIYLSQ